jgi:molybdopterin converting factor small subunit
MRNVREQTVGGGAASAETAEECVMKIGFFGRLRDVLGDEREVAAEAGETVARLRIRLAGLWPEAAGDLLSPRVRACVGDTMVGEDFVAGGHERIEFLPPLSGG